MILHVCGVVYRILNYLVNFFKKNYNYLSDMQTVRRHPFECLEQFLQSYYFSRTHFFFKSYFCLFFSFFKKEREILSHFHQEMTGLQQFETNNHRPREHANIWRHPNKRVNIAIFQIPIQLWVVPCTCHHYLQSDMALLHFQPKVQDHMDHAQYVVILHYFSSRWYPPEGRRYLSFISCISPK